MSTETHTPAAVESRSTGRSSVTVARRWLSPSRRSLLTSGATYGLLLVLCAFVAYWAMFSQFKYYDDEGFFDYSLKLFVAGQPLYTADFSGYGPFYYELFGAFFTLIGHSVTTDSGRLVQLSIWLGSSLGIGLAAQRLTGRLSLGAISFVTAFTLMTALINEPMHAEALVCALLTATMLVTAYWLPHSARGAPAALGALAAALLLTKVNVGVYAIVAVAFAVIVAGAPLGRFSAVRGLVIAAFVGVAPIVMLSSLNTPWARAYTIVAATSALSIVFVSTRSRTVADLPWVEWVIGGFAACSAAVLAIIFLLGPTPGALFQQIVLVPYNQNGILNLPISLGGDAIWWSLAATALAWALRHGGRYRADAALHSAPSVADGLMRTAAGVAILLSLGDSWPFDLSPDAAFALAMPLAWIAALPSRRDTPGPQARLVRVLIPSLAVLQGVLAYPVAGSQVTLGSIVFVLCGAVCLADGAAELVAWSDSRPSLAAAMVSGVQALFVALAVAATFEYVVQPFGTYHNAYEANVPLRIAGASRLRLDLADSNTYSTVVATLRANCRTLMSLPGLYSFNIWTGLPTPSPLTGEQPYWRQLSSDQQRRVVAAAEVSPGLCVLRDDSLSPSYTDGKPVPRTPLVAYVVGDQFVPFATFPPYVLEKRRG